MSQFGIGVLSLISTIFIESFRSIFEFVINPLLTFFVDGFTMNSGN